MREETVRLHREQAERDATIAELKVGIDKLIVAHETTRLELLSCSNSKLKTQLGAV